MKEFDNVSGKIRENLLMETAMRIHELFDDMCYACHLNPDKLDATDSILRFQIFCDMARDFESEYYGTETYDDDWIGLTDEVFTKKLKEIFS